MGASLGGKGAMGELNLTPLIDIVLVVLIIMMVNIPIAVNEMGVKLPDPNPSDTPPPDNDKIEQLVIAVYKDEVLALNRMKMTEPHMFEQVTRRLRPLEKKNVFIDAHPKVRYGLVVDMMDLAREAGAERVSLARMKEDGPAEWTGVFPGTQKKGIIPGNPRIVGPISTKKADEVLKPKLGALLGCYDTELTTKPNATGRVVVRVDVWKNKLADVDEDGEPDVMVTASDFSSEMNGCIEDIGKTLSFGTLPGSDQATAAVSFPLIFSPG
jgi:biopolymer transport protein ExbD